MNKYNLYRYKHNNKLYLAILDDSTEYKSYAHKCYLVCNVVDDINTGTQVSSIFNLND